MTAQDLRGLSTQPFALIAALDARYGSATTAAGQQRYHSEYATANSWPGLTLRLGGQALVIPQHDVREVRDAPAFTRVPQAQPWLQGLANVRGDLLAVVDLQSLLLGQASPAGLERRLLVFNDAELPVGFLVDKVEGMRNFQPEEQAHARISEAPAPMQPWLLGAFVREEQLRWVFSLRKLARSPLFMNAAA